MNKVSIIITHHKTPDLLQACLKSIRDTINKDITHEIFVADSDSDSDTIDNIAKRFPNVQFINSTGNLGYSKIVNRAILKASGEFIFVLNADILAKKNAINLMLDYMKHHSEIGILGPKLINFDGTIQYSRFRFYTPLTILCRRTFLGKTKWGQNIIHQTFLKNLPTEGGNILPYEADWLMGSALLLRAEALEQVGLLDERFFMYFEDIDWCRRFKDAGYKIVYFPTAVMYHYHIRISHKSGGLSDLFFNPYARTHVASAIKYFWKYKHQFNGKQ